MSFWELMGALVALIGTVIGGIIFIALISTPLKVVEKPTTSQVAEKHIFICHVCKTTNTVFEVESP